MYLPLAILNNLNATSIFFLGLVGLLLFGKDLPLIARNLAKEYFRYKKMINEATADIQREMESAATHLENEKRKLESEINTTIPSLDNTINPSSNETTTSDPYSNGSYGDGEIPSYSSHHTNETPAKPAADPMALDVPSPSSHTRSTDAVKSPAANVAKLDTYQKSVPPPSRIPPSL
ncbi:MAG: hypothetical protein WCT04_06920 [Planctomycetota bacterium]